MQNQNPNQLTSEKASQQKTEKKPYATPKLTRHGKVEEMTQDIINPGPSDPV